jgi:hypothetical protein
VVDFVETSKENRGFARSRAMADCLRRELLYSEKPARDTLFSIIEAILAEQRQSGDHRIVSRLIRDAAERAEASPRAGDTTRWRIASRTVVNAMVGAAALLDIDGRPVPAGIAAQGTPVASLAPEFRDLTEAFLVETLIARLDDITVRDHRALAHVMFRQFDPDVPIASLEDRLAVLLARLAGRVELQGTRYVARVARDS